MNTTRALTLLAILALAAQPGPAFESVALLPASPGDLTAGDLVSVSLDERTRSMEREPVSFSWALPADREIDTSPDGYTAASSSFWFDVEASELRSGVAIDTVAPGALVRLNPIGDVDSAQRYAIDPANLQIEAPGKSLLEGAAAMEIMATVDQLKAADAPYAEGTSAFRLRNELGSGRFVLRAPRLDETAGNRYFIQVLERESDIRLELSTDRISYLGGQSLEASVALLAHDAPLKIREIDVELWTPTSAPAAMKVATVSKGSRSAAIVLPGASGTGLWEVHARVTAITAGLTVRRNVRAAFSVAAPTARLTDSVELADGDGLTVAMGVEVASPGRYEVRGVLFANTGETAMAPVGVAHSAAWLEPGFRTINLAFDSKIVAGLDSAALEIRDLQLLDQSRMGTLQRQDRALLIR